MLAGIDNGDLADNTPFSSDSRKSCGGNLVIYVKRLGDGDIFVTITDMLENRTVFEGVRIAPGCVCG